MGSLAAGGGIPSSMSILSADLTRGCLGPVAGSIRVEATHLHPRGGHLTLIARAGTEKGNMCYSASCICFTVLCLNAEGILPRPRYCSANRVKREESIREGHY